MCHQLEGFPSGQREQTVNLPRKLRRFESFPLHQNYAGTQTLGEGSKNG